MLNALFTECFLSKSDVRKLGRHGVKIIEASGNLDESEIIKKLKDIDIYIIGGTDKATENVIKNTNLKLIIFYGTGYENHIDINAASHKGIQAANTPKANAYTVAEHCVALILDAVKQITYLNNSSKLGIWRQREAWNLENKTLGIVGMGTIGGCVARIMKNGFGMKVIYNNRGKREDLEKQLDAHKVDLQTLLKTSDVVSVNASYSDESVEILNANNLGLVKKGAVLVCTSRAELIDPRALKKALTRGNLSCAAFDSYYKEPLPSKNDDKWGLLSFPDNKFIITPHTAYGSREAIENMNRMVIDNLISFIKTGQPKYKVT
ncbi:MAG: D-isomer specific 2-hydroxyacid dehydrogenase, NAD-binding protein [Candidatus Woesebacteria bacterium GW2011_GWA1_39_21]|uniref:D-isomer specific 2-hydroxyacid dehydrogenase, NAD-binding protein n=1 Tax=Candidatus Woesebacteria bacterium GW2011_GWA1_39_21 TaxID=1618550 RepID=A0A0G0RCN9_9BACT|nr:MAG: D-isomer specific 2-hydroxyacid dehydrogenase, NAD-binding protein [Candidatus Woesebacteria bacterium GW2011_GWA1_39_21]